MPARTWLAVCLTASIGRFYGAIGPRDSSRRAPPGVEVLRTARCVLPAYCSGRSVVSYCNVAVNCYRHFYRLQPELTRSIYDQFISQLQASIKEEIQEVKEEGNLEALFSSLDKIVEEAKEQEEPAWRPSGIPEEDVCSAMVPYLLKHRAYLRKVLKEKEEENKKLAESVLAGRDRIAELQQLIQDRKQAWQAISKEQRELIMTFKEPQ
nr:PREDICTED: polyamine-modulated factor 1-like [Struthio camelus australis]